MIKMPLILMAKESFEELFQTILKNIKQDQKLLQLHLHIPLKSFDKLHLLFFLKRRRPDLLISGNVVKNSTIFIMKILLSIE